VPVRDANLDQPTATLYVVASPSGGVLSSFTVGDDIRLAAQLLDGRESWRDDDDDDD
jgi:hypothetical protein